MKKTIFLVVMNLLVFNHAWSEETKSEKSLNVHTNPLTWLVGVYSLGVDIAVNQKMTLGGSYNYFNFSGDDFDSDIDADAKGLGLRAQYFLSGVFNDGIYLSGFVSSVKGDVNDTTTSDFAEFKSTDLGFTVGYFWMWENFNIQLGLGLANTNVELTDSSLSAADEADFEDLDGVSVTGDFRLGLAF